MYVDSLEIKNFRCFREARIELRHPDRGASPLKFPNINLLLGINGSGKSSILKALALASLSPVLKGGSGLSLYRVVRNPAPNIPAAEMAEFSAALTLHAQDIGKSAGSDKTVSIVLDSVIRRIGHIEELEVATTSGPVPGGIFEDDSPAFLVVGYGVNRRVQETVNYGAFEKARRRRLRYQRVASLFEDDYGLVPLQSWLPEMQKKNPGRYKQVVNLINRITPDDMSFEGRFLEDEFYFKFRETEISFGSLSDGYRHFIGWIADLLYHICMGAPSGRKLVDNHGLVLVDEIDLLLHPEWQRTVLQSLSTHLPNMQFVFTTHSPIVASSVESQNIFVMEPDPLDGSALVVQYHQEIYGKTAEQVLLSSFFGLDSTRPASFVESLEPLSNKAIKGDRDAAVAMMEKLAEPVEIDKSKFDGLLN